mmetsp:Transcript_36792/g.59488  ORF Transcript_36792/g.59488 Transcript_36792/m.59488 type:complete len:798 (+) Transcript_36792:104-2497(+)
MDPTPRIIPTFINDGNAPYISSLRHYPGKKQSKPDRERRRWHRSGGGGVGTLRLKRETSAPSGPFFHHEHVHVYRSGLSTTEVLQESRSQTVFRPSSVRSSNPENVDPLSGRTYYAPPKSSSTEHKLSRSYLYSDSDDDLEDVLNSAGPDLALMSSRFAVSSFLDSSDDDDDSVLEAFEAETRNRNPPPGRREFFPSGPPPDIMPKKKTDAFIQTAPELSQRNNARNRDAIGTQTEDEIEHNEGTHAAVTRRHHHSEQRVSLETKRAPSFSTTSLPLPKENNNNNPPSHRSSLKQQPPSKKTSSTPRSQSSLGQDSQSHSTHPPPPPLKQQPPPLEMHPVYSQNRHMPPSPGRDEPIPRQESLRSAPQSTRTTPRSIPSVSQSMPDLFNALPQPPAFVRHELRSREVWHVDEEESPPQYDYEPEHEHEEEDMLQVAPGPIIEDGIEIWPPVLSEYTDRRHQPATTPYDNDDEDILPDVDFITESEEGSHRIEAQVPEPYVDDILPPSDLYPGRIETTPPKATWLSSSRSSSRPVTPSRFSASAQPVMPELTNGVSPPIHRRSASAPRSEIKESLDESPLDDGGEEEEQGNALVARRRMRARDRRLSGTGSAEDLTMMRKSTSAYEDWLKAKKEAQRAEEEEQQRQFEEWKAQKQKEENNRKQKASREFEMWVSRVQSSKRRNSLRASAEIERAKRDEEEDKLRRSQKSVSMFEAWLRHKQTTEFEKKRETAAQVQKKAQEELKKTVQAQARFNAWILKKQLLAESQEEKRAPSPKRTRAGDLMLAYSLNRKDKKRLT